MVDAVVWILIGLLCSNSCWLTLRLRHLVLCVFKCEFFYSDTFLVWWGLRRAATKSLFWIPYFAALCASNLGKLSVIDVPSAHYKLVSEQEIRLRKFRIGRLHRSLWRRRRFGVNEFSTNAKNIWRTNAVRVTERGGILYKNYLLEPSTLRGRRQRLYNARTKSVSPDCWGVYIIGYFQDK